ncbi:putative regulator of amino acid metabolism, contains ACT domain [Geoglobus ahangari]|uniref:Putative regulator of amino acid metabolism, contains ACT domain n=1 Tax=Geoglobus ahangari TaxID=113653 RepID=A0A0F7IG20_9EURY|nr:ACT domain-containing protein [Geoglobus ahangari]AKG91817.1 putative regulator of amino acid metabolism, contains ACT domain [Geoglobus ahangari]
MWGKIQEKFEKYPSQIAVAKEFLKLGIAVRNGKTYCGDIELVPTKIAEAVGVDRKVVVMAIQNIESDEELKRVFSSLRPVAYIADVARILGFGVLEVYAESQKPGIVASITGILAREGISIRYMLAEDPELSVESKLTIVTETKIPGRLVDEFLNVPGVEKIVIS